MSKLRDLTGQRFGKLTVLKRISPIGTKRIRWLCRCDCGNQKDISADKLVNGNTTSCGCYRINFNKKYFNGERESSLHSIWNSMKDRCNNPNNLRFKDYGGRGIKVVSEWLDYRTFYDWSLKNGYKPGLTIDRTDNNKGYQPNNCRWVTQKEQARNTRRNYLIQKNGVIRCLTDWANDLGVPINTMKYQIEKYGDFHGMGFQKIERK